MPVSASRANGLATPLWNGVHCGDAAGVMPQREDEMHETVITRDGLARLREELERLKRVSRRSYRDAREEQALLERRISLLEQRLRGARLVEPQPGNGRVDVGERVRLRDLDSGERLELQLVGPLEADPSEGRVSVVSPLGKAVVGLRRGQVAGVDAPLGRRRLKVVAVEPPAPAA
jgi:transcription elongation factor GreA